MSARRTIPLVCVIVAAAGCSTLTTSQLQRLEEAQRIADKATAHYHVDRVRIFVRELQPAVGANYAGRQGWIILNYAASNPISSRRC